MAQRSSPARKHTAVRSRISSGLSPTALPFAPQPKSVLRPKSWTHEVEEGRPFCDTYNFTCLSFIKQKVAQGKKSEIC